MGLSQSHIPVIIDQYVENVSFLWLLRDAAVKAPNYTLKDLADLDNRVDAHIDGLRIAGNFGWDVCAEALKIGEPGEVFAAAVLAFESNSGQRIDAVINVALATPENYRALISALGWLPYSRIEALLSSFRTANSTTYHRIAIAADAIHRRDPGSALLQAVKNDDVLLRARALKAVGELNRRDLTTVLREHWQSDNEACRFWSLWSSVMLADYSALKPLMMFVTCATPFRQRALALVIRVADVPTAQNWLKGLWQDPAMRRLALIGAGMNGDPLYIPELMKQMVVPELARVAGEAFSMITGVDLAYQDLEGEWPEGFEAGPTEDPEDENVELDSDEDLPWPDPALIQQWWEKNLGNFQKGRRYLVGQFITAQNCSTVLLTGSQRQRMAAALELTRLLPDTPMFETRAPGFQQQRMLG